MSKHKCLVARITPEHLADYLSRRLSSAQIARIYSVRPACVNRTLPKRPPRDKVNPKEKALLRSARNDYRNRLALGVISGLHTAEDAAETAHCSIRTMYRHMSKVRSAQVTQIAAYPPLLLAMFPAIPQATEQATEQASHA